MILARSNNELPGLWSLPLVTQRLRLRISIHSRLKGRYLPIRRPWRVRRFRRLCRDSRGVVDSLPWSVVVRGVSGHFHQGRVKKRHLHPTMLRNRYA